MVLADRTGHRGKIVGAADGDALHPDMAGDDLAERRGVNLEASLTWPFEFENQPYFAGFRSLASNGIDKPVLNVFRMFARMTGQRLAVESNGEVSFEEMLRSGVRNKPDVSALASLDRNKLSVLVWHYHDDDVSGPDAEVELVVNGVPLRSDEASLRHFRIDEDHGNAFSAWKRTGSPQTTAPEQYTLLEKAGQLAALAAPEKVRVKNGKVTLKVHLPRQAVSLLELVW